MGECRIYVLPYDDVPNGTCYSFLKIARVVVAYSILDIYRSTPKDICKRIFEAYKVSIGCYNNMIGSDYNFVGTSIISYRSEINDKIIYHNITVFSGN